MKHPPLAIYPRRLCLAICVRYHHTSIDLLPAALAGWAWWLALPDGQASHHAQPLFASFVVYAPLFLFFASRAGRSGWLFLTDEPATAPSPPSLPLFFVRRCRWQVFFSCDADRIYFERRQRRQPAAKKEPAKRNVKLTLGAKKIAPSIIFFVPSARPRRRHHAAGRSQRRSSGTSGTLTIMTRRVPCAIMTCGWAFMVVSWARRLILRHRPGVIGRRGPPRIFFECLAPT